MAYSKIIGGIIVLGILTILIFSGPAEAFAISLEIKEPNVGKGEIINIEANIETGDGDAPSDVDFLIFRLENETGSNIAECKFTPKGDVISGCDGIDIKKINTLDTGYCKQYGYGYGCKLNYKIKIDTEFFDIGNYSTSIILGSNGKETEIKGKGVSINIPPNKVCSIRANNGKLIVNNMQFEKNKINFYIPQKNAFRGEGYLTGQLGRERFLYRFKIDKVLESSNTKTKVQVSGKYRIGTLGKQVEETAVLTFDKVENVTSLVGSTIEMSGMKINFREWCF